ncbi:50S ribosomal protein L9 [Synergistales bacterium]|nr:50S ribosomal protein L9 [Synergistales bacterium]
MKIILKKDVDKIGKVGELLDVSDGYARNFLFPRGLADEATDGNITELKIQQERRKVREDKEKAAAIENKKLLEDKSIRLSVSAGENGKLFGSVTAAQVSEALETQIGVKTDKRSIKLPDAIKQAGNYKVSIRLHAGVQADVPLIIEIQK